MENIFKGDDSRKFSKVILIIGVLLSLFLIVKTVNALREYKFIGINPANPPAISVTGEGEVFAVPDVAEFSFSVTEEAKTAGEAQPKVNAKVDSILKALKDRGVEDKDIKTLSYDVYPKYEQTKPVICREFGCSPSNQQIVGYQVNQTIQVKVKDIEKANLILGDLGKLNVTNLSGLSLTVDDEDALMEEAREKAIKEARSKAEKLAQDLGVDLGKIISFNENGNMPIYYGAKLEVAQDSAASNPNIPVGENKIVSHVTVVFEIR